MKYLLAFIISLSFLSCTEEQASDIPHIGFLEAFEDATISKAKTGFIDALKEEGFDEDQKTIHISQRNAQGEISTLNQIMSYFIAQKVDLIGTSTTLSAIASVQINKEIPVFMSVSSMPNLLGLVNDQGIGPSNLYGVGEDLNYIDTSFSIIPLILKDKIKDRKIKIGMIYNQSEPQSVDAFERILALSKNYPVELISLPLNSSADAQMVTRALLQKDIDAFFANPDNTVFAAFETIYKNCTDKGVPIFTSEAGLVERGAVAAFGADIYLWGFQAGKQAAQYLKDHSFENLKVEKVNIRKRVYNPTSAEKFNLSFPEEFMAIN